MLSHALNGSYLAHTSSPMPKSSNHDSVAALTLLSFTADNICTYSIKISAMSGLELLAVVGCVAAVVSAYKDGSSLVKELMEKRRKKKALKDAQSQADLSTQGLEQSLTRGSVVVQGRYDHEFQSLGPQEGLQFANGDRECMDALKNIIIHLQSQVILNLRHAWSEDTFVDFSALQVRCSNEECAYSSNG